MGWSEKIDVQSLTVILLSVRVWWVRRGERYFNTALWVSLSFFLNELWITTQSLSYSRRARKFALMCALWQPPHTRWTESHASYTECSVGFGPQSVSRQGHRGTPVSALVSQQGELAPWGQDTLLLPVPLCQAGSRGPRDSQDRRLGLLGRASWCYLAPQVLMFFPSMASSTREMW